MFIDADLITAMETSSSFDIGTLLLAEFNLNDLDNIAKIGNYFHRPQTASVATNVYDPSDLANAYTDSDLSYEEYKVTDEDPFRVEDKSSKYFYSLGDCFLPFRPRSGINKARFRTGHFIDNVRAAERPRYYIPNRKDYFKYWSSYKKEGVVERGISSPFASASGYIITDAAPFVVYENSIAANRIVVKMQTNVGNVDRGTTRTANDEYINDPLYDYQYASVPKQWKIQKLEGTTWTTIANYTASSERSNGDPIVGKDGYVELFYGVTAPETFIDTFDLKEYTHETLLPETGQIGDAYIYGADTTHAGTLVIWDGAWTEYPLSYSWQLLENAHIKTNGNVTTPVNPLHYGSTYREIDYIDGLRIVIDTMNATDVCFDLIELSPRLSVDFTDYLVELTATKNIAGNDGGLPVGNLLAGNGQITLTNVDNAFTVTNTDSVIASLMQQNVKFIPFQIFYGINGANKYVPLKSMYADKLLNPFDATDDMTIPLRDLYFRLETNNSPSVLYKDTRLTYAVSALLDSIGISNYVFKTADGEDPILPYFFVEKNVSVAEILQRIAIATQSAMFFDEFNNFVVMTKEYLLPAPGVRETDFSLSGNDEPLANIIGVKPNDSIIFNNGSIGYTIRYIQREISTLGSTINLDSERTYRYKPVLLWEVSANEETKTVNEAQKTSSGFALGAAALNTSLTSDLPVVSSGSVSNNIIDLGESVYWLPRYKGYLYANGEIIRFDAVEYAVPVHGNVWIGDNAEYQRYFANLPFNGKIYPTGRVRIFSEPNYNESGIVDGPVKRHGRGQFDTPVVSHQGGLGSYWSSDSNTYGLRMYSSNLFSTTPTEDLTPPALSGTTRVETGSINTMGRKSTRNGVIKNFMASNVFEDGYVNRLNSTTSGTIQSSALVFRGPRPEAQVPNHRDFISYVYKDLSANGAFQHFGTRMRIIGKTDENFGQIANGSSNYYSIQAIDVEDCTSVNGGSGGIGIMVDPANGSGYYLELIALSDSNIEQYSQMTDVNGNEQVVHNIVFYKVNPKTKAGDGSDKPATPQKLWGGLTNVIVDAGLFAGQDRLAVGENNSVYDLAIEYEVLSGGAINFYLYINNILVKIVKDRTPLPIKTNMALFVRASSECMFENIYAIEDIIARGQSSTLADMQNAFDDGQMSTNEFLKKYAVSGMIQQSYLSNISGTNPLQKRLYFDEFGTIMREAVHFTINYDQAFPAFYSKVAKTFTNDRAFVVSKFYGGAYDAEFIVFNSADKAIVLDETTGSYLRILGITFTQNSTGNLTVDDYYKKYSDASQLQFGQVQNPELSLQDYNMIKASRAKYGSREFSLDSMYVQSEAQAEELMKWIINKTLKPRQSLSIETFPMAFQQVGDLVNIYYDNGVEYVDPTKQFIIGQIQYTIRPDDISQSLVVTEV